MSNKEKLNPIAALQALPGNIRQFGSEVNPMERPLWEIDNRFLNPFAPVPEVQTWVCMGDRPALPCKGIITLSAKPKQGKSIATYALLTPILTRKPFDTLTPQEENRARLAVVFDTEMDTPTLAERYKTMLQALNEAALRFQIVPLLEIPKSKRREYIEEITAKYNPDIVVIDQVARLVANFNDAAENVAFGEWLAQYAAKRSVIVVIHQNKAADNTQMKGHLGSLLEELAVENYTVKHENGIFYIIPTNARKSRVDETSTPVTFALNDSGAIITAAGMIESNKEKQAEQCRVELREIFGDDDTLRHSEIKSRIMEKQGLSQKGAERKIRIAAECGAIKKIDPANIRSPYQLTQSAAEDFSGVDNDDF